MSKYALEAAADAYRLELEGLGIKVHVIEPGPIEANFRQTAAQKIQQCLANKSTRLNYETHIARLIQQGPSAGSLPAEACSHVFMQIVYGHKKRPRYLITNTAKLAATLKRILASNFHHLAKTKPVAQQSRNFIKK